MNTHSVRNCYTYLIGWSNLNIFYYGRKTAKGCSPESFWDKYFTSSEKVKSFRESHGEPDLIQIRKTFGEDIGACKKWESRVLKRINAAKNVNFLNAKNGDDKWDSTGVAAAKCVKTNKKLGMVSTSDDRWVSGEIISMNHGKLVTWRLAKDLNNNKIGKVDVDDPRWKSGEIIHYNKNVSAVNNKNNAPAKLKDGTSLGRVSLDDPRWKSGEIQSYAKGYINVRDDEGKIFRISTSDEDYISGKYLSASCGYSYSENSKKLISESSILARSLNRVCDIKTHKEYSIQNFFRYVLSKDTQPN